MKVYQKIAQLVQAMDNCARTKNTEWYFRHRDTVEQLVKDFLPSGSGFDRGTQFVFKDKPDRNRLEFTTAFHHMNDNGYYTGWSDHAVIVSPDLAHGFVFKITGRNKNDIKDYIGDVFYHALNTEVPLGWESYNLKEQDARA